MSVLRRPSQGGYATLYGFQSPFKFFRGNEGVQGPTGPTGPQGLSPTGPTGAGFHEVLALEVPTGAPTGTLTWPMVSPFQLLETVLVAQTGPSAWTIGFSDDGGATYGAATGCQSAAHVLPLDDATLSVFSATGTEWTLLASATTGSSLAMTLNVTNVEDATSSHGQGFASDGVNGASVLFHGVVGGDVGTPFTHARLYADTGTFSGTFKLFSL